jgi:hypothetical protein
VGRRGDGSQLLFQGMNEVSATMERSARFVAVPLLRHLAFAEFSENRDRVFAVSVEPINTYTVVGVGVFRDLELIGRSVVVKFHGQRIRREDVVDDVTTPLSDDVFICGRIGDVCRQYPTRK